MNKRPVNLPGSRGEKTLGNTYKDRYVTITCPECGHDRAYEDAWHTRISYKCLKRACRHNWYRRKYIDGISQVLGGQKDAV